MKDQQKFTYITYFGMSGTCLKKGGRQRRTLVQKCAAHIILGESYISYKYALDELGLESIESRRTKLCIKFVNKAEKHKKFASWFKLNDKHLNTRVDRAKYCDVFARHARFQNSPISFLTRLLNQYHISKK